jgi:hypothetical protein
VGYDSNRVTGGQNSNPVVGSDSIGILSESPSAGINLLQQRLRHDHLTAAATAGRKWLWYGYLAGGQITLLTSQWKSGKTTLVAVLLARMGQGGRLAELPVAAGRAAIVSEEGPDNWAERCRKLDIGKHVSFFCRPFAEVPTRSHWRALVDGMLELHQREGLDLVVIDPLALFLPASNENSADGMMDCLLALRDLTARGMSVLLIHHADDINAACGREVENQVLWKTADGKKADVRKSHVFRFIAGAQVWHRSQALKRGGGLEEEAARRA